MMLGPAPSDTDLMVARPKRFLHTHRRASGCATRSSSSLHAGEPRGGLAARLCNKLFVLSGRYLGRSAFISVHERLDFRRGIVSASSIFRQPFFDRLTRDGLPRLRLRVKRNAMRP
jgi:hypothetical protein